MAGPWDTPPTEAELKAAKADPWSSPPTESEVASASERPKMSKGKAAVTAIGQEGTLGLGARMGGRFQADLQRIANLLPKGSLEWAGIDNRYPQEDAGPLLAFRPPWKDQEGLEKVATEGNEAQVAKAKEDQPLTYAVSGLAAAAPVAAAPHLAAARALGVAPTAMIAASRMGRAAQFGAEGAGAGAARAVAAGEDLPEVAKQAGLGAGAGLLGGAAPRLLATGLGAAAIGGDKIGLSDADRIMLGLGAVGLGASTFSPRKPADAPEPTQPAQPKSAAAQAIEPATPVAPQGDGPALPAIDEGFGAKMQGSMEKYAGPLKAAAEAADLQWPTAENWVLRDLDLTGSQGNKLQRKGLIASAPRALLDDPRYAQAKTLPKKLELIKAKQAEAGQAYSDALSRLDGLANRGERFSPAAAAARIKSEVLRPLSGGLAADRPVAKVVEKEIKSLLAKEKTGMSFSNAEALKRRFDPHARYDKAAGPTPQQQAFQDMRRIIKEEVERAADQVATRSGNPDLAKGWMGAKKLYGAMEELTPLVESRAQARQQNSFFSLNDYIAGVGGSAVDPTLGVAAGAKMLGNKWLRERGPHVMALGSDKLSKSPMAGAVAKAIQAGDATVGKVAGPLMEAAKRGENNLAVAIFMLSQRYPELQEALAKYRDAD